MIAYNRETLRDLFIRQEARDLYFQKIIDKSTLDDIIGHYTKRFYNPNIFIKIALGLVTTIICSIISGLFYFLVMVSSSQMNSPDHFTNIPLLIFGIVYYLGLEVFVSQSSHYKTGIDNALIILSFAFLTNSISGFIGDSMFTLFIGFVLAGYLALRFADPIMSIVSLVALQAWIFFELQQVVSIQFISIILIAISALCYFFLAKALQSPKTFLYHKCLGTLKATALFTFYLAGNYFLMNYSQHNSLIDPNHNPLPSYHLPAPIFYWTWTMGIPFVYLVLALKRKNLSVLHISILLLTASIFTFKYYHSVLPIEKALLIAGAILIAVCYALIRYLKTPRHMFSFDPETAKVSFSMRTHALMVDRMKTGSGMRHSNNDNGAGSY